MPFQSGNKLGGRTADGEKVRAACRKVTEKAVRAYVEALEAVDTWRDNEGIEHSSPDHETRMKAATHLLDRGYGRPAQSITGEDGGAIQVESSGLIDLVKQLAARRAAGK